ncbi:hypothetical protein P9112_012269 [Eukaryota sp. TZLM1-RC]
MTITETVRNILGPSYMSPPPYPHHPYDDLSELSPELTPDSQTVRWPSSRPSFSAHGSQEYTFEIGRRLLELQQENSLLKSEIHSVMSLKETEILEHQRRMSFFILHSIHRANITDCMRKWRQKVLEKRLLRIQGTIKDLRSDLARLCTQYSSLIDSYDHYFKTLGQVANPGERSCSVASSCFSPVEANAGLRLVNAFVIHSWRRTRKKLGLVVKRLELVSLLNEAERQILNI